MSRRVVERQDVGLEGDAVDHADGVVGVGVGVRTDVGAGQGRFEFIMEPSRYTGRWLQAALLTKPISGLDISPSMSSKISMRPDRLAMPVMKPMSTAELISGAGLIES